MAGLGQKCEGKTRRQAKALLLITSAALETQFDVSFQFAASGDVRKVCCAFKNVRLNFGF